ncbi:hypothetical protein NQ317_008235 [Molorchus minor]|uniref:C2H2-type domain-containing protein n=1 Tax=Molorchus minor TaxID=1323400 RepID=A0ABQ9J5B3_9CUCU|nr:hypothetical protein NQ317_008235 [Molorchus minor]
MAIQPPDKPKIKEREPAAKSSSPTKNKPEDFPETISLKKDVKNSASAESCKQKPQKILKESASIFGSVLSHIDDRLLEGKKKKEERRHSHPGKDERRASDGGKGSSKSPDAKLRSERKFSFSNEDLSVKCSGSKPSSDPRKKESHKKSDKKDKHKSKSEKNNGSDNKSKSSSKESKSKLFSLSGTKSYDEKKEILKHKLQESPKLVDADKETKDSDKEPTAIPNRIAVKKDDELFIPNNNKAVENKEDSANRAQALFKRLADKYNPKPKKTTIDADVDKSVADSIEQNMRTAQPKLPAITPIPEPTPPPASLVKCTRIEQYPTQPAPLSTVLQNIMSPSTTHLINSVVNQLKQTNAEAERLGLLPTPSPLPSNQPLLMRNSPTVAPTNALLSPPTREDNWVSEYCRESNFVADFVRDNFNDDYSSNMPPNDFGNAQFNPPMRQDRLRFEAPAQQQGNFAESPRYVPPMNDRFGGDNFNQNAPFQQDRFRQGYSYGSKKQVDMQSLDYYPPNAPVPANVNMYNCGPPLLSPEMPNFQNEQKPNTFGIGHDPFSQNEPVWRTEDNLPYWQQDQRMSRDPRTYREYREMREARDRECRDPRLARDSRDPRDNRDSRDNRDPRENRDPRVNRDPRDPRLKVRDPRDKDYERDRSRDVQPNKFDRIYSRTNRKRDRSRSRSRTDWSNSQSKESFVSPLDSLYTGKEDHRTGKGYGVQSFRIPKIKKEDDHKEKEEQKVTSTNEDLTEPNACEPVEMELESDNEEGSKAEEKHTADANKAVEGSPREKDMEKPQEVESSKEVESEAPENSFSDKELSKITKIIKANEDEEDESSEEEDDAKKEALKQGEEKEVEIKDTSNEAEKVDSEIITPRASVKRRARRISSSSPSKEEPFKESECPKTPEPMEIEGRKDSGVIVTVGERIKSRKRIPATLSKPKKRCRTELDMLHEDIQDMFIRDGVLTASGKRMCRLLKDDPNVLAAAHPPETNTLPVEVPKVRKKPGPKPKPRPPNASEVKVMKSVRVVIPKMPESNVPQIEETPKRTLRSSARNVTYADSDDESDLLEDAAIAEDKSLADEDSSVREDDSDESSEDEKDETAHPDETRKSKVVKRKRGKIWASGIIHNKKKKKKQSSFDESDVTSNKDIVDRGVGSATGESDGDKSYVEPDKGYYVDSLSNKSKECKICNYRGRFITTHYKTNHPESEILSSRLSPAAAEEAVRDAEQNLAKYESIMRVKGGYKFKYVCRFCEFSTHVPPTIFYDHVTTHTGEYRHICPMCSFSASSGKTLKVHLSSCHQNIEKRVARKSYGQTVVFGYLCGECNYVQLTRKNVEDHINVFHLQKPTIYKITLSKVLDEEIEKVADEMGAVEASVYDKVDREPPEEKVSEPDIQVEKQMPPPQRKKRGPKPGPRSAKKKMQERAQRRTEATTDSDSVTTDTESVSSKESTNTSTERDFEKVAPVVRKRISREVSMEEEPIVGRSRRAAKDKAAEKLKNLMEFTEGPPRKRCQPTEKNRVESEEDSVKEAPQELPKEPPKEIVKEETVEPVKDKKEGEVNKKEEDKPEVKKRDRT